MFILIFCFSLIPSPEIKGWWLFIPPSDYPILNSSAQSPSSGRQHARCCQLNKPCRQLRPQTLALGYGPRLPFPAWPGPRAPCCTASTYSHKHSYTTERCEVLNSCVYLCGLMRLLYTAYFQLVVKQTSQAGWNILWGSHPAFLLMHPRKELKDCVAFTLSSWWQTNRYINPREHPPQQQPLIP